MKRSQPYEEKVVKAIRQVKSPPISDLYRQFGVSDAIFYHS
ncbi:MAG: hypothetical protein OEY77_04990 [Nitrospira sp.]|nr:hypothetical protein [Nitrospira sp.]